MKFLFSFFLLMSCATAQVAKHEELLKREDVIWGFDFLPDERVIFTERGGVMGIFDPKTKAVTVLKNVPKVYTAGQAGLLDVRVHPEFSKNNLIYFTYAAYVGRLSTTALGRAELLGGELKNVKELFLAEKPSDEDIHYGSRIAFDGKGHVFFAMGDRNDRPKVRDLSYHNGKMMRLKEDGSVPKDNPYVGVKDARPEIWALGLRSPQGLYYKAETNELWEAEMGPRGGDEINLIEAKKDYGWAEATYGREYYGPRIGKKDKKGTEQPLVYWVPSISPSALTFYTGDKFPEWKGNAFLACLSGEHIRRIVFDGKTAKDQEKLLKDLDWRFRNVRTGPDGYLWFSTDDGRIGRLVRK